MLKYRTIYTVNKARRRYEDSRRDRYSWRHDGITRDQDRMNLFTFEREAVTHSADNLEFLLATARAHDQQYVVLTDNKLQIAGERHRHQVADRIAPVEWRQDFAEWLDETSAISYVTPSTEQTTRGGTTTLQTWRHCFCLREHRGVYEVATGRRMTNREQIIRTFWNLGFATWRGRPPTIAKLRWSGEREELEELTALTGRYWNNQYRTDVARKIVSAHRSINRYAAWPGAW